MVETTIDLAKPFFLIKIFDKDTDELKYSWSPNIFMDKERQENDSTITDGSSIEDIEVRSNNDPPINTSEIKIDYSIGMTPKITINDTVKIYFGYYTLNDPQNAKYSLAYTGRIDHIKASLNHTIIKASSKIKKLTNARRDLAFSRNVTISDIIKRFAIEDGGLEQAPNGITTTTISKQKGYAISREHSIYQHIKKIAELVGFDIYMDVFDRFNARIWSPKDVNASASMGTSGVQSAIPWLSDRDDSETNVREQLIHPIYFGVNAIDMLLDIKAETMDAVAITTLADSEGCEVFTIDPPVGNSGSGKGRTNGSNTSETGVPTRYILPRVTKDDAEKIADNLLISGNPGLSGTITIIGAPQVRLGDGVKILGHIHGKTPFHEIDIPSSEYDANYTTDQVTQRETKKLSNGSRQAGNGTIFKITGIKHLFNDNLGFITKLEFRDYNSGVTIQG